MKKRILILLFFVSIVSHYSLAQQVTTTELLSSDEVTTQKQSDEPISSVRDTIETGDSIIVIHTVCAPICSSRVRVYNKEWQEVGLLYPPFSSIFPEAYIENGKILWRNNDTFDYTPTP